MVLREEEEALKLKVHSLELAIEDSLFLCLDRPQVLINPEKCRRSRTSESGLKQLGDEILKKTRLLVQLPAAFGASVSTALWAFGAALDHLDVLF